MKNIRKVLFLFSVFFALFLFRHPVFAASYPQYVGYVNDFAHVLSPNATVSLNAKLGSLDQKTTDQVAVVTVNTTQPETIEDYSIHLADQWKVGQKGKDNGVIMLFAMKDHRMRIEVGRGLEGDLTDIQSKHIQTDIITPEFKQGNYEVGITKGVDAVIATITHDASATANLSTASATTTATSTTSSTSNEVLITIIFWFIVFSAVMGVIAFSPHTRLGGRGRWGIQTFWGESGGFGGGGEGGGGGFGGFGGGGFSGGGSSGSW